jgi:hypothetical protein
MQAGTPEEAAMVDRTISQVREELAELVGHTESERIRLIQDGRPVGAIVSLEDLELLEHIDQLEDALDLIAVEEAKREHGDAPTIPWEEVKRELGIKQ